MLIDYVALRIEYSARAMENDTVIVFTKEYNNVP